MNDRLPPEIQVHSLRQGVSFELPIRPIGSLRVVGKWLARAGLAGCCFLVILFLSRLFKALLSQPNWPVFGVFSLLSLAPFFVLSFGLFMIGRFMVAGRCRVTLQGGQLRLTERAGWLHWTRVRSLKGLRSFEVKAGQAPPTGAAPAGAGVFLELATLHAEFEGGKPMWVLAGYPRAWLLALARELSHQLEHGAVSAEADDPTLDRLVSDWLATYDLLVWVPILQSPPPDGIRASEPAFQRAVDQRLARELARRGLTALALSPDAPHLWLDRMEAAAWQLLASPQLDLL